MKNPYRICCEFLNYNVHAMGNGRIFILQRYNVNKHLVSGINEKNSLFTNDRKKFISLCSELIELILKHDGQKLVRILLHY